MKGFKGYINLFTGGLVFVAFLLLNLTTVEFAPQSFLSVLLNSGLMMICWILIRNAFAEQGLISGQKDLDVRLTKKEHLITSTEISTYKSDFNIWCEIKNAERLKQKRIAILSGSTLVYEDYFDEAGQFNGASVPVPAKDANRKINRLNKKRYRKDCRLLKKARFAYVAPYEVEEITAKENLSSKKHLFGLSVKQWKNIRIVSSVALSLAISLMLAFVSPGEKAMTQNAIIILVFELLIMAGSAFMFYFSASSFVCGAWREGLIQKVRIMEEFYRNVVGTITYGEDKILADGTRVLGQKTFTKSNNYKPLTRPTYGKDKEREEAKETIQTKNEGFVEMAAEECAKQGNDSLDNNSRVDILEPGDNKLDLGANNFTVVLERSGDDNSILGGPVYSGSSVANWPSVRIESDSSQNKEPQQEEKREGKDK